MTRSAAALLSLAFVVAVALVSWMQRPDRDDSILRESARPVAAAPAPPVPMGEESWRSTDSPVVVARRLRAAADKRAFYDHAVKVGGGSHLYIALEAASQCLLVNSLGALGAEQQLARWMRGQPDFDRRMQAMSDALAGCEGFDRRPISSDESLALQRRIAEQPDAIGKAYALGRWRKPEGDDEARKVARELVQTGDPHVIRWVAKRFGRDAEPWTWALCDLGMDCDPDSYVGRAACFAGECGWKQIDDVGTRVFSSNGVAVTREGKDALVAAVRTRDWKRLGL